MNLTRNYENTREGAEDTAKERKQRTGRIGGSSLLLVEALWSFCFVKGFSSFSMSSERTSEHEVLSNSENKKTSKLERWNLHDPWQVKAHICTSGTSDSDGAKCKWNWNSPKRHFICLVWPSQFRLQRSEHKSNAEETGLVRRVLRTSLAVVQLLKQLHFFFFKTTVYLIERKIASWLEPPAYFYFLPLFY